MGFGRKVLGALVLAGFAAGCGDSGSSGGGGTGGVGGTAGGSGGATGGTGGVPVTGGTGGVPATGGSGGVPGGSGGVTGGTGGEWAAGGSGGAPVTGGTGGVITGDPAVRFVGRFDTTNAAAPQFEWSGSEMIARFSGTQVSVHLNGSDNYFEVVIDGQASKIHFTGGDQTLPLATGLAAGDHEVQLYRITEAFFWSTQFLGFDFGSGALLAPPPTPNRRLEVIGDSISAGYGDEGAACTFSAATENHYLTYESISARTLGADLVTLAWSGIGMYRNTGGDLTNPRMPERYLLTMPASSAAAWNFASYIPDAVVINLGTNDFSGSDPGQPFVDAYLQFATDLRGRYPNALVYLATSPMLGDPQHGQQRAYLQSVIDQRATQGDTNLRLLDFATQDQADGLGCDWHPNLVTHQKMADVMTAALRADLGW